MYYVKLPFAEDLRQFDFDNLDAIKRNQPSDEQLKTIDSLITSMDLTHADRGFVWLATKKKIRGEMLDFLEAKKHSSRN